MPMVTHVTAWLQWDVPSGVGETQVTQGTWERMEGGVDKTSAAMLNQRSNEEGSGKEGNKNNSC